MRPFLEEGVIGIAGEAGDHQDIAFAAQVVGQQLGLRSAVLDSVAPNVDGIDGIGGEVLNHDDDPGLKRLVDDRVQRALRVGLENNRVISLLDGRAHLLNLNRDRRVGVDLAELADQAGLLHRVGRLLELGDLDHMPVVADEVADVDDLPRSSVLGLEVLVRAFLYGDRIVEIAGEGRLRKAGEHAGSVLRQLARHLAARITQRAVVRG